MHIPKFFEITDRSIISQFVKDTGLGTLVTTGSKYPTGTHIPFEPEVNSKGEEVLTGHISKANPQWKEFKTNPHVLVIFLSPAHHYISSSWYNHPNAPTWNYLSVHIYGELKIIEGKELWNAVGRMTDRYEKGMKRPVSLDALPPAVQKQLEGIVGFEIRIEKAACAFKLSQNRNKEDFENILKELRAGDDMQAKLMADIMEKVRGMS